MSNDPSKKFGLRDGRELIVRQPVVEHDLDRFLEFIEGLPDERKNYLRYNVTDPKICRIRMELLNGVEHWRLLAEIDGEIVGSGTLDREPYGWTRHLAQLRAVVHPDYTHLGVGTILFNRLVALGSGAGIERLYTEVIKEQTGVVEMLEKEGFVYETVRKDYARDLHGRLHDVVILSNDLEAVWSKLEQTINELDLRYSHFCSQY